MPRMNTFLTKTLICFFILFLFLPQRVETYELEKNVRSHTLPNGLKILMLKRDISPTVSIFIRNRSGAVNESEGRTGTAHFLEHLLFKGTKSIGSVDYQKEQVLLDEIFSTGLRLDLERKNVADSDLVKQLEKQLLALEEEHKKIFIPNEIDRLYTENGGLNMNASTGQDVTTYKVSLPANKLELWARIESDRIMNAVFREFYRERDVVMEERRQRIESDPDGKLYESFLAAAFPGHPYGRPIIGTEADIASFCPIYTKNFYQRFYVPNNTVIALVGDLDEQATLALIDKYFGHLPFRELEPLPLVRESAGKRERRVEVVFPANPKIIIGYKKPTIPAFDDYVFDVIDYLLATGRSSRFYRNLIESKGLASVINTTNGVPGALYDNLFTIFAEPRLPVSIQELEREIYRELDRLKEEPVSGEELAKIINIMQTEKIRGLNSNDGLASMLSYFELIAGDFRYLVNHLKNIEKITPADIMNTASRYFTEDNKTVAVIVKGEKLQK